MASLHTGVSTLDIAAKTPAGHTIVFKPRLKQNEENSYGVELDTGRLENDENDYLDFQETSEGPTDVPRAVCSFDRETGHALHPKWMATNAAERRSANMKRRARRMRSEFSEDELKASFRHFNERRALAERTREEERWHSLACLTKLLSQRPEWGSVLITGGDFAIYETMARAEPGQYMSRPRFLETFRRCFYFESAVDKSDDFDRAMSKLVHHMFNAFETPKRGLDWRVWLVCVSVVLQPTIHFIDHLWLAFYVHGSNGSMLSTIVQAPGPLKTVEDRWTMGHLPHDEACGSAYASLEGLLLECFSHEGTHEALRAALQQGWKRAIDKSARLLIAVNAAMRNGKQASRAAPLFEWDFERILSTPAVADLTKPQETWKALGCEWVREYAFERAFMHPRLLDFLVSHRRHLYSDSVCAKFFERRDERKQRFYFFSWCRFLVRRRRCRYVMAENIVRFHINSVHQAFLRLRQHTLLTLSIVGIQRVIRGFLGRTEAQFVARLHHAAALMQALVRMFQKGKEFRQRMQKRCWAATEIQRRWRGRMGIEDAARQLLRTYDQQMKTMTLERRRMMKSMSDKAAIRLQRTYRRTAHLRQSRARARREKNEQRVRNHMDLIATQYMVERRKYEKKLERWFAVHREETLQNQLFDDFTSAEKLKILKHRRAAADEARKLKLEELAARDERLEAERVELWLERWAETADRRAEEAERRCHKALNEPEDKEERALRRKLLRDVRKRTNKILAEAAAAKILLEVQEAKEIATKKAIQAIAQEERALVNKEMKQAAKDYFRAKEEDLKAREEKDRGMLQSRRKHAAMMFQAAYRKYVARRELRKRCTRAFRKEFDRDHFCFVYVDIRNDTKQYRKPYALGEYDIRAKDQWVVIHEGAKRGAAASQYDLEVTKGHFYFYNPFTLKMQWQRPEDTVECAACQIEFAQRYCNVQKRCLCVGCWTKEHSHITNIVHRLKQLRWKEISGAMEGSVHNLQGIELYPDHSEAELGLLLDLDNASANSEELKEIQEQIEKEVEARRQQKLRMLAEQLTPEQIQEQEKYLARIAEQSELVKNRLAEETMRSNVQAVSNGLWKPQDWPMCCVCAETRAHRHCIQCDELMCVECFHQRHEDHPVLQRHTFHNVKSSSVRKLQTYFQWPNLRTPQAAVSTTEAFRRAKDLFQIHEHPEKNDDADSGTPQYMIEGQPDRSTSPHTHSMDSRSQSSAATSQVDPHDDELTLPARIRAQMPSLTSQSRDTEDDLYDAASAGTGVDTETRAALSPISGEDKGWQDAALGPWTGAHVGVGTGADTTGRLVVRANQPDNSGTSVRDEASTSTETDRQIDVHIPAPTRDRPFPIAERMVDSKVLAGSAADFTDLELDDWLGDLLHLPKKQCIRYSMALGDIGCMCLDDLVDGRGIVPVDTDQDLVDIGFRRGHARRVMRSIEALQEARQRRLQQQAGEAEQQAKLAHGEPTEEDEAEDSGALVEHRRIHQGSMKNGDLELSVEDFNDDSELEDAEAEGAQSLSFSFASGSDHEGSFIRADVPDPFSDPADLFGRGNSRVH